MPTTSKMGIVYPSSSDLVKDGATNMGTIATTVDAKTGLILLNTTSFTGVSSSSFPANVFSATYKNYKLVLNVTQSSSNTLNIRYRTAGTDNTASTYYDYFAKPATNSASFASNYNNGGTSSYFIDNSSGTDSVKAFSLDIFSPFEAQRTYYAGNGVSSSNSGAQPYYGGFAFGGFNNTTSFDSMTLFPGSGTITGSMSIFAYNS